MNELDQHSHYCFATLAQVQKLLACENMGFLLFMGDLHLCNKIRNIWSFTVKTTYFTAC